VQRSEVERLDWIGRTDPAARHMLAVRAGGGKVYTANVLGGTVSVVVVSGAADALAVIGAGPARAAVA
jgi:hypothetical protein